jgi:predicted DNA-binding transcriptional regulator AlpA
MTRDAIKNVAMAGMCENEARAIEAIGDCLVTTAQVCAAINMSKSWLETAIKDGDFPGPLPVSAGKGSFRKGGIRLWSARDISAWIEGLREKRLS